MKDSNYNIKTLLPLVDKILLLLSIILLLLLIWDTFVDQSFKYLYNTLYILLWVTFGAEYTIKILFSKHKLRYILSEPLAIFVIAFPFLRTLSLLPVSRYGLLFLIERLEEQLPWTKKYKVVEILLLTIVVLVFSSDILLIVESNPNSTIKTFGDAIWFSVATISTAGYGDLYPRSIAGRIIARFLLIFGASVYGIITAKIASLFIDKKIKKDLMVEEKQLEKLSNEEEKIERLVEKIYTHEKEMEEEIKNLKTQKES